MKKRPIISFLS